MTSRGYLQDLIESIGEDITLTSHLEEKLRFSEDEEEIKNLQVLLQRVLTVRREKMSRLLEDSENGNPHYWCVAKHAIGAFWRQLEVWEATKDAKDWLILKIDASILAMGLSLFLGLEFQVCERCLADYWLTKQIEES